MNSDIDPIVLKNIQNQQYVTIEKLRQSLAKSEKRAHLYETKFAQMKDKLYNRCKRLNDEVINVRRAFEKKMKEFFANYTGMLKEIIFTNNKDHTNLLNQVRNLEQGYMKVQRKITMNKLEKGHPVGTS